MDQAGNSSSSRDRTILHIDMNAFYCACHAAAEPLRYAGRATAVAGSPETRHGVVVTASYEARRQGVRATMTVSEALRACPRLILIAPDFDLYRAYSRRVFQHVQAFSPLVEIFSIDECWADVTGVRQFGSPETLAAQLQQRLLDDLGLPCSIGIGPNKFVAKMASDLHKPMGLTVIDAASMARDLWPLPVGQMFGVGQKTAERLLRLGLTTIGELAQADEDRLARLFGRRGPELKRHANGLDDAPVQSEPEPQKSVGHSITLPEDLDDPARLETVLLNLSDQVGRRVRRHAQVGRTVQLTIRYANRETLTRARTLPAPTDMTEEIWQVACALLRQHRRPRGKVRLLGVTLQNLSQGTAVDESVTVPLFSLDDERPNATGEAHGEAMPTAVARDKQRKLTEVTDRLRDRYGEDIVVRGRMMDSHPSRQIRDRRRRGTSLQKDLLRDPSDPHGE